MTIPGVVQFKREAGLGHLKHQFLAAGAILLAVGLVLIVVKCACFRTPIYQVLYTLWENENDRKFFHINSTYQRSAVPTFLTQYQIRD